MRNVRKNKVILTNNRRLEDVLAEALEQCWEGKLPFQAVEQAIRLLSKPVTPK